MIITVKCPKCDYKFRIDLMKANKEIAELRREIKELKRGDSLFGDLFGGKNWGK